MTQNKKQNVFDKVRGFTLIELLVVIAIIGILTGIVYASFGDARASARDEARKVALKEMQLAIELYKAQEGRYPEACRGANSWSGGRTGDYVCSDINAPYIIGLAPGYIGSLPYDPDTGRGHGYLYKVNNSGTEYKLLANGSVEINRITSYDDEFARCPQKHTTGLCRSNSPQPTVYAVYSAGAWSW